MLDTVKSPVVKAFVFIDSLGWKLAEGEGFLHDELPHRRALEMQFGYSCTAAPTILTGKTPAEHGHLAFYDWAPDKSPFRAMRWIAPLLRPKSFWRRGRVRHQLSKLVKRLCGFTGYFQLYGIDLARLPKMDYCEKTDLFVPGGLAPVPNLADVWQAQGMRWHISDWRRPEAENFRVARALAKAGATDRFYVYAGAFDTLHHCHPGDAAALRPALKRYAALVRGFRDALASSGRPFELTVFSDHGMTPLRGTADVPAALAATGLVWGRDYASAVDSTMARFWWLRSESRNVVEKALSPLPGHWLSRDEMERHGIWRDDRKFGDAVFLADTGIQFCPGDMGDKPLPGMHGYNPEDEDSLAAWLSTVPPPDSLRRIRDVFAAMAGTVPGEFHAHRAGASGRLASADGMR